MCVCVCLSLSLCVCVCIAKGQTFVPDGIERVLDDVRLLQLMLSFVFVLQLVLDSLVVLKLAQAHTTSTRKASETSKQTNEQVGKKRARRGGVWE